MTSAIEHVRVGAAQGASPHDDRRTASRPSDTNAPETERSGVAMERPWTACSASGSGSALQGLRCGRVADMMHFKGNQMHKSNVVNYRSMQ